MTPTLQLALSKKGRPTLGDPEADALLADVLGNAKRLSVELGCVVYVWVGYQGLSVHVRHPRVRPLIEVHPDGRRLYLQAP